MALKFKCSNCDEDIIVRFLSVGETAKCRSCGAENVVPETAVETNQKPDYMLPSEKDKNGSGISKAESELEQNIQEALRKESIETNPFKFLKIRSLTLWIIISYIIFLFFIFPFISDSQIKQRLLEFWTPFIMFLWISWKFRKLHISPKRIIGGLPSRREFMLAIGILIPLIPFNIGVGILSKRLISAISSSLSEFMFPDRGLKDGLTLLFVLQAVIVAPFIEELLFRGILIHRWATKWNIRKAILVSSLIFGIGHLGGFIYQFVGGVVVATLYMKTRKLLVPIITHFFANAFVCLMKLLIEGLPDVSIPTGNWEIWIAVLPLIPSLSWVIYFIHKNWPNNECPLPYFSKLQNC